jgi:hypothetical protein
MTLSFRRGARARGRSLSFGIDRDEAVSPFGDARDGNGADVLGGATLFPEGTVLRSGLGYTARLANGRVLRGNLRNRIGSGWTPVDGTGYINAERAVDGG